MAYGLSDRGQLKPGLLADINVIDFDALRLYRPEAIYDLPAGGRRLVQRADGYRYTVKSGQVTFEDGESTGALPGSLVRGGREARIWLRRILFPSPLRGGVRGGGANWLFGSKLGGAETASIVLTPPSPTLPRKGKGEEGGGRFIQGGPAMAAQPFTVQPLDASFGAVVTGLKLAEISDDAFDDLYRVWLDYALLVFPGQHLTHAEQIAFARRFGAPEFEIAPISNVRADGTVRPDDDIVKILKGNMGWHCDSTYMPVQAKGAVFHRPCRAGRRRRDRLGRHARGLRRVGPGDARAGSRRSAPTTRCATARPGSATCTQRAVPIPAMA
ncbi:MAG: TauD/TfdA family dioxygenase [Caulobacteraceae bacterium]